MEGNSIASGHGVWPAGDDDAKMDKTVPVTDKVMSVREQGRGWMEWIAWASCCTFASKLV